MIIKFNNSKSKHTESNFIKIEAYIEKEYFDKIMKYCKSENITFGEFLNDALGTYVTMNYIDDEEYQKKMKELWNNFNK